MKLYYKNLFNNCEPICKVQFTLGDKKIKKERTDEQEVSVKT